MPISILEPEASSFSGLWLFSSEVWYFSNAFGVASSVIANPPETTSSMPGPPTIDLQIRVTEGRVAGSFRDPSGFVFGREGRLLRQVNAPHVSHYRHLVASRLYQELVDASLLIRHREVSTELRAEGGGVLVLEPDVVWCVSRPHEWCFSQLQEAGLLTCELQRRALARGMSLKDASAQNIQFVDGRPIFIDTLSFEVWEEGLPWKAYRQFCEAFLAPLALMAYRDLRLGQLFRAFPSGVPLDLAARLLPLRARLSPALGLHLHLHAAARGRKAEAMDQTVVVGRRISRDRLTRVVDHLARVLKRLKPKRHPSTWTRYYDNDVGYSDGALQDKLAIVARFAQSVNPRTAWDLGANTGVFSRTVAANVPDCRVVGWDADPACVEEMYRQSQALPHPPLPLVLDVVAHSGDPSVGLPLDGRGSVDLVLVLGLIHHLVLRAGLPLPLLVDYLARISQFLIVEFVPPIDANVMTMIGRIGICHSYDRTTFDEAFERHFTVVREEKVRQTNRTVLLMRRHS